MSGGKCKTRRMATEDEPSASQATSHKPRGCNGESYEEFIITRREGYVCSDLVEQRTRTQ